MTLSEFRILTQSKSGEEELIILSMEGEFGVTGIGTEPTEGKIYLGQSIKGEPKNKGTFEWALAQMRAGKKVRLAGASWHLRIKNGKVLGSDPDPGILLLYITSTDWEIAEETHDFKWAIDELKAGRSVARKSWDGGVLQPLWPNSPLSAMTMIEGVDATDWVSR